MSDIKSAVMAYFENCPPAAELFKRLLEAGKLYLIGGALREFKDHGRIEDLRDADFIIQVTEAEEWKKIINCYQPERNHFDGYKFICEGLIVDVWEIENTWALRNRKVAMKEGNCLEALPKTVFLNMDAILYDLTEDIWYDKEYQDAKRTGVLDVVLEENPYIELNVLRAMILQQKYHMEYSDRLKKIIADCTRKKKDFSQILMQIQKRRYHREILGQSVIDKILKGVE